MSSTPDPARIADYRARLAELVTARDAYRASGPAAQPPDPGSAQVDPESRNGRGVPLTPRTSGARRGPVSDEG